MHSWPTVFCEECKEQIFPGIFGKKRIIIGPDGYYHRGCLKELKEQLLQEHINKKKLEK